MELLHNVCTSWQVWTGTHTTFIQYVCVSAHVCLEASVLSCPSPQEQDPVSPAISQSDSWELDSGTRKEGGRKEGRGEAGQEFEQGGQKRQKDGKRGRHTEGMARSLDHPPDLWGPGVLLLRGHCWKGWKKNYPHVSLSISAPASTGLGGGEQGKTRRQIRLVSRDY